MPTLCRSGLIAIALSALGAGLGLGVAGCVSKPPPASGPLALTKSSPKSEASARTEPPSASEAPTRTEPPSVAPEATAGSSVVHGSEPTTPLASTQTTEERRAALDKRLDASLAAFDAKLRSEQQGIAQERDAHQSSVVTVSDSQNVDHPVGDTDRIRGSSGSNRDIDESRRAAGELKSDRSNGNSSAAGNGAVANEVADGNDDDVVARRLRKAAEQETDPELKDKLWKEYVEYKKNTGK